MKKRFSRRTIGLLQDGFTDPGIIDATLLNLEKQKEERIQSQKPFEDLQRYIEFWSSLKRIHADVPIK